MTLHAETLDLIAKAQAPAPFDPARVKEASAPLLDLLEELETLARGIQREADEVQILATSGSEDPSVCGTVALYRSKAGAALRSARELRDMVLQLRKTSVEYQRADRQIRATLKKEGHEEVPVDDLTAEELDAAPAMRR
jgi:hypothetical protein